MEAGAARRDLKAALVLLALAIVALFLTSRIDLSFTSDLETFSGPRAYPALILLLMVGLILAAVAHSVWRLRASERSPEIRTGKTNRAGQLKSAAAFAALVLFIAAFERLGYLLAMWPLLIAISYLFGARSLWRTLAVTFLMMITCLLFVRYGLNTVLPEGVFGIDRVL